MPYKIGYRLVFECGMKFETLVLLVQLVNKSAPSRATVNNMTYDPVNLTRQTWQHYVAFKNKVEHRAMVEITKP